MKTYKFNDGTTLSAETPAELLEKLRNKSFTPTETLDKFCAKLVQRIAEQTGHMVESTKPDVVLGALLFTGLATEVLKGE